MKKEKEERKEREKENYRNEWKKKMKGTEHKKITMKKLLKREMNNIEKKTEWKQKHHKKIEGI